MTRKSLFVLAGLLTLALVEASLAADAATQPAKAQRGDHPEMLMKDLLKEFNLSEEKQEQVEQILQTHKQDMENWQKEHGAEFKKLRGQADQPQKNAATGPVPTAQDQLAKLLQSRQALVANMLTQLSDVLTAEQMDKVRQIFQPQKGRGVLEMLRLIKLSDKQQTQVNEIVVAARAEAGQAANQKDRQKTWRDAVEKIRTTVLTDDQRRQLEALRNSPQLAALENLKLTDDQRKRILDITGKARADADAAGRPLARREILGAAWKKITNEVLTPEQRKLYEQWKKTSGGLAGIMDRIQQRHRADGEESSTSSAPSQG